MKMLKTYQLLVGRGLWREAAQLAMGAARGETDSAGGAYWVSLAADAWYSLGLAAMMEESFEEAWPAFAEARALDPGYPGLAERIAGTRHGLVLERLRRGDAGGAWEVLQSWREDTPEDVELSLAGAAFCNDAGDSGGALALLEGVRDLRGNLGKNLHCLKGHALYGQGRLAESLAEYERAMALALAEAATGAGAEKSGPGMEIAGNILTLRAALGAPDSNAGMPEDLHALRNALALPAILEDAAQADKLRQKIRAVLRREPGEALKTSGALSIMPTPPFYLAFHGRDDKDLLGDLGRYLSALPGFDAEGESGFPPVEGLAGERRPMRTPSAKRPMRVAGTRRIGFASTYVCNHTIMSYFFRVLQGLFPKLARRGDTPYIISVRQPDNPYWSRLASLAVPVVLPANLEGARALMRSLDLDILVYLDLGLAPLTWALAFARLAPLQCALYGHPMTTGIPAIDVFLSPAPLEPNGAARFYTENLRALPCLLSGYPTPAPPEKAAGKTDETPFYLCAQSLFKVQPDFDEIVKAILAEDKEANFNFFVSPRKEETAALAARLGKTLGPLAGRVNFLPQCAEEEFNATLRRAAAVLDTPHFSGGSTSYKALGLGVPVLTLEGPFMRSRQTSSLYRHMGATLCLENALAESINGPEGMAGKALRLAHSPALRRELGAELTALSPCLFKAEDSVQSLFHFLGEDF